MNTYLLADGTQVEEAPAVTPPYMIAVKHPTLGLIFVDKAKANLIRELGPEPPIGAIVRRGGEHYGHAAEGWFSIWGPALTNWERKFLTWTDLNMHPVPVTRMRDLGAPVPLPWVIDSDVKQGRVSAEDGKVFVFACDPVADGSEGYTTSEAEKMACAIFAAIDEAKAQREGLAR